MIKGDKIDVEITNPDSTNVIKNYEVVGKDVNGNITLKDLADNSQRTLSRDQLLELDAKIAVDAETKAKVTLTDTFGESVNVEDSAHAQMDAIRGIKFNKDITTLENGEKTTKVRVYLNEDAREGDTVEFKYTDPDNHTQTKTESHVLTSSDIANRTFDQALDINARSAYDLEVKATLKTSGGLESKSYEPHEPFHIDVKDYTVKFDASKDMKGGKGNDTLVVDRGEVDFNNIPNLNSKVESFENIELKGGSEIKFDAKAIFDITDNLNTILKIKGDATNKVDINGKWKEDTSVHADAGFKGYSSVDQVNGQTLHIQIEDKIQTDL